MHGNPKACALLILICLSLALAFMPGTPSTPAVLVYAQGLYYTPITITERSGKNLTNYAVGIILNTTNFDGWNSISSDGSDIYFLDQNGNPLYYWIESFNIVNKRAVIWIKVPYIPAKGSATIYMYYGGINTYASYNNPSKVFAFFDHFNNSSLSSVWRSTIIKYGTRYTVSSWSVNVSNSLLRITVTGGDIWGDSQFPFVYINASLPSFAVRVKYQSDNMASLGTSWAKAGIVVAASDLSYVAVFSRVYNYYLHVWEGYSGTAQISYYGSGDINPPFYLELRFTPSVFAAYYSTDLYTWSLWKSWTPYHTSFPLIGLSATSHGSGTINAYFDYIYVRPYVDPEPSVSLGASIPAKVVYLPSAVSLVHSLLYAPNSTQFSHSLTATNTSVAVAGYVTGYGDRWGWMLYAKPYISGGTAYKNSAQLVSTVSISVPYSYMTVKNVTLYATATNTGSSRYISISILDSSGTTIASTYISSVPSTWSPITLSVNRNVTGFFTVKIVLNATSTETSGENISVKDVKIYCEYRSYPQTVVSITQFRILNATAQMSITVAPTALVNASTITIYLASPMNLTSAGYGTATYIGNTTMNGYTYKVYTIANALSNKTTTISAGLTNILYGRIRIHTHGYESQTFLAGEKVTIELPETGNITVDRLGKSYMNTANITLIFNSTGSYKIGANITKAGQWKLGFYSTTINITYGSFSISIADVNGKTIDYESVVTMLKDSMNRTVAQLSGKKLFSFANLVADNYTITLMFRDAVVATTRYRLNISTTGKTTSIISTLTLLQNDYRKLNKSIIWELGKKLSVKNIDARYPYSRLTIYINGSGDFKLYVNYFGKPPTSVAVSGNVSRLKWWWDGTYLVITGRLGSVGAINITDLYRLRIEAYSRTGNPMPTWFYIYVNKTIFNGSVADALFHPATYAVILPGEINGFKFYGFFDGYRNTTRYVNISSNDVVLKAWYRVPTRIVVRGVQVTSLLQRLFPMQDQYADVYIEGYVYDYYGNGVPNRAVNISLTDEHGYTVVLTARTDASGYFRTQVLKLVRGVTYSVSVGLPDDDTYVASMGTVSFKPEELPTAPVTALLPSPATLIAVTAIVALSAIGVATSRMVRRKKRRFVTKKH